MNSKSFNLTSSREVKMARNNLPRAESPEGNKQEGSIEEKIPLPEARTDLIPEVNDTTHEQKSIPSTDLGERYIGRMKEAMEEWSSREREGYHVSDVCLCPRLNVFRKIDRLPTDAKTVSIFAVGKAIHEAVQLLYRTDKRTFEIEKYVEHQDIQGSVDIHDRRRNIPLEFKTTRASDIKKPKSFHVEQLKYYMAMLDAPEGYMLYQLLMHFGNTPFKTFQILMNAQERKDQRDKLVKEVNSLKRAMEAGDPSLARSVRQDPDLNWLCKDCPYSIECKRMESAVAAA
jgi:CRISPR/Cas system-associated exonuclease Cas4 (RecB family)